MGFEGAFGRILFGRKTEAHAPSAPDSALDREIARYDLLARGIGHDALSYMHTGAGDDVLGRVATICRTITISTHATWFAYEPREEAATQSDLDIVRGLVPFDASLDRFFRLRVAAQRSLQLSLGSEHVPTTIRLLYLSIRAGATAMKVRLKMDIDAIPAQVISLADLRRMVASLGGSDVDLLDLLLQQEYADWLTAIWRSNAEFETFARDRPAEFAAALVRMERGQLSALNLAGQYDMLGTPELVAALVALLGKGVAKPVRETVISRLATFDAGTLVPVVRSGLATGDIETRDGLVDAAARNGAAELLDVLADRAGVEKAAKVKAAIQAALEIGRLSSGAADTGDDAGYPAIDGSIVAIPPLSPLSTVEFPAPTHDDLVAYFACVETLSEYRATNLAKQQPGSDYDRSEQYQPFTEDQIEATFHLLTRAVPLPRDVNHGLLFELRRLPAGAAWFAGILDRLPVEAAMRVLLANPSGEMERITGANRWTDHHVRAGLDRIRGWLSNGQIGLRELFAIDHRAAAERTVARGEPAPIVDPLHRLRELMADEAPRYHGDRWENPLLGLPLDVTWPWLATGMAAFDEAFGMKPAVRPLSIARAMTCLALLPALPARYVARLVEIGLTEKLPVRRQAMALLRGGAGVEARLEAMLDDARQPVRINAATWLADIRAKPSEKALRTRFKKEKSEPVRTALVEALQRLGADLSDVIGPASLLADMAKAKAPAPLPEWLSATTLPVVHFRDGTTAPPALIEYWLALAIRLKDPSATGQFGIYLDQLDPADAQTLSNWVLECWVAYDTHGNTLDEANAYAAAQAPGHWRWVHRDRTGATWDQILDELKREKLAELPNSGADTKGMLALAARADPVRAAQRVRWFLKKHGRRSSQAMALLDLLAGIASPVTLQVVIAASVRLKQKSTQKHAAEIAERYAEDRGWSVDELADRTVPSAGFDDDGILDLPCGEDEKPYSARLDARLAIHLFNPEGKAVKTLPAGDDDATKEAKKALTAAKKELAQVVDMQTGRLFEAMCVERSWPVADWQTAFHGHPVMRRLIERLVWQGLAADGTPLGLFRATQEGDFTDAQDSAVDLAGYDAIRLAHGALVDQSICAAWIAHLADYEIVPLIAQFGTTRTQIDATLGEATMIEDRKGWVADSMTYRGIAAKRGYDRVMGDGGGCNEYEKTFSARNYVAQIHHSGSYAQDENNKVALKGLSFRKAGTYEALKLKDVPPVMLAECYADFHALAAKGEFAADWEKVAIW